MILLMNIYELLLLFTFIFDKVASYIVLVYIVLVVTDMICNSLRILPSAANDKKLRLINCIFQIYLKYSRNDKCYYATLTTFKEKWII